MIDRFATVEELRDRRKTLLTEARDLASSGDEVERDHLERIEGEVEEITERLEEMRDFQARAERLASNPRAIEHMEENPQPRRDAKRTTDEHRGGLWLANQPAIRDASNRLRAAWGMEQRALVGSGTTGGGAFTPVDSKDFFWDFLAAQSVALRSGIATMQTERDSVIIPHALTDASSAWVAEAATITPSDPTAEQITATPRKLAALTQMSNEVLADSNPSVLDWVSRGLLRSLALKFDLGAFEGSGSSPEIRGLKNVSGISTVSMGVNGAAPTNLDPFADAIGALEADNANASAIVMHPRTWKTLVKIKEVSGSAKALLQDEQGGAPNAPRRSLYGVPVFLSSQLSITETQGTATNASSAYVYAGDQVVAVLRQDARVELDSSRLFNSDQSELRCTMRADLVVPNPKAVCRILGIIP
jgi:HK97 family phage major capsid protein